MADESFSFRWGIPLLDDGHTTIPNFMLDNYAQVGVSRAEFLTIVHLARYQYESRDAECKPSVATVARQMGYTRRGLRKLLAGLEERGLLARHFRSGETTIYDFSGFSRAVLELSTGEEPQFLPKKLREEPQFLGDRNPGSSKEEKIRRKAGEEEEEEAAGSHSGVWCSIHNVEMERREKDGAVWYSHRDGDGWCKGAPGDVRPEPETREERHTRYVTAGVMT
jgi:hypothetical protein